MGRLKKDKPVADTELTEVSTEPATKEAKKAAGKTRVKQAIPVRQTERIRGENFKVKITLIEDLLGTVPKNKELYTDYIASKRPPASVENQPADFNDELEAVPEKENGEENVGTGFFTDADGIYLLDYQFKGMLKEAANNLKEQLDLAALKSKIDNFVFVSPRNIYLQECPDDIFERPLRGMTPTGPRVALAKSDRVKKGLSFVIEITLLAHSEIDRGVIETLLDYGMFKGIGQFRNGGWGRFLWEYTA